eukprot:5561859-Prymnesium_polylepis.1
MVSSPDGTELRQGRTEARVAGHRGQHSELLLQRRRLAASALGRDRIRGGWRHGMRHGRRHGIFRNDGRPRDEGQLLQI